MNMFSRNDKSDQNPTTTTTGSTTAAKTDTAPIYTAPPATPDYAKPGPRVVSVIGKALKITGQLESTEDIQVDGEIDGDVRGAAVKIGSNARVKGSVYGDEVELAGTIEGKIEARKVILTSSAHMSGDVIHQDIKIESGAYISGHCRPELGKVAGKGAQSSVKPAAVAVTPIHGAEKPAAAR